MRSNRSGFLVLCVLVLLFTTNAACEAAGSQTPSDRRGIENANSPASFPFETLNLASSPPICTVHCSNGTNWNFTVQNLGECCANCAHVCGTGCTAVGYGWEQITCENPYF